MIFGILFIWVVTAIGLWLTTKIVPGLNVTSTGGLLKAALVLGLINAFIRPALWILTLPLTVLTFGLFAVVLNAFMIWLTGRLVDDFIVRDFFSAILAAIVMSILGVVAFIVFQWLMMGDVHWVIMRERSYI